MKRAVVLLVLAFALTLLLILAFTDWELGLPQLGEQQEAAVAEFYGRAGPAAETWPAAIPWPDPAAHSAEAGMGAKIATGPAAVAGLGAAIGQKAEDRVQVAPRSDGGFRLFWNGDHRDPWPILRRELAGDCFWTHPAWTAYLRQLRMMRSGTLPKRYLTWSSGRGQGIGNSMQGLLTSFYLAMMSGRSFKISWGSPVSLEKVYNTSDVDWRISQTPEATAAPLQRAVYYDFDPRMNGRQVSNIAYSKVPNVWVETNVVANQRNLLVYNKLSGLNFSNTTLLDLVRNESQLPGCAFHSLFDLPKLWQEKEPMPPGPQIGIHLRFGDSALGINAGDKREGLFAEVPMARLAVECAQQLAEQAGFMAPCLIIVESDSEKAKRAAKNTTGLCHVWVSAAAPKHSTGAGGLQSALATWYAWARLTAVELLLFTGSTFSRSAGNVGASAVEKRRLVGFRKFLPKAPNEPIHCKLSPDIEPR